MWSNGIHIAGPCAAESREQVLLTAEALMHAPLRPTLFRAGIWKPRTKPNTFQGIGEQGLAWLQEVQERYQLPCCTEVSTPQQVQMVLHAGITQLWIGARTSANPLLVQALLEAMDERVKLLIIKNPVNEDPALWIGNIERAQQRIQGWKTQLMAVHRGCGHRPCWHMAYLLHQHFPNLPLLLDPSHLSGEAARVPALVHTAADLAWQGTMIEVHPQPQQALSDAQQQLTPEQWVQTLHYEPNPQDTELLWLRLQIDEIDEQLWNTLLQRMDISRRIGEHKRSAHMAPYQPERYQQMLEQRLSWAKENRLPTEAVQSILQAIHSLSVLLQR